MNTPRDGLYSGLAILLPLLIWVLARLQPVESALAAQQILREGTRLLPLLQALLLCLFAPWKLTSSGWRATLISSLVMIMVPWPLLALGVIAAAAPPLELLLPQIVLLLFTPLLTLICDRLSLLPQAGHWPLRLPLLQLTGVVAALYLHQTWYGA
ncbi:MAG TPA: hypothetical protein ENK50_03360 [Sedimenticola sp.]|nr:hypothetical protein [Sedimenticola sp.]